MEHLLFDRLAEENLGALAAAGRYRQRQIFESVGPVRLRAGGRVLVNFSSNNYLGLTHHPAVIEAVVGAVRRSGCGAGASPLVSGYFEEHASAERALARWKHAGAAVLLPSGYQAAHAAVQTITALAGGRTVRFFIDRLIHASLIDGIAASRARFRVFPHLDMERLRQLLEAAPPGELKVVVTESVFSMDGDSPELESLAALKERYGFALLLDEAHASGVYGPEGAGLIAEKGLHSLPDVTIVTLSKGIGLCGGAVCGTAQFCEALVNFGRAMIFSTSVPPMIPAGVEAALTVMRTEPERQLRLRGMAAAARRRLRAAGYEVAQSDCPIIPIILGSEESALRASAKLREAGLLAAPIRPPAVPRGTSRLRITLSCEHSEEDVESLLRGLESLRNEGS